MDTQLVHRSVVLLALSPLAAWISAFGVLFVVQKAYPAPRWRGRSTRPTTLSLRIGSLAVCLAWLVLLLGVR